MKTIIAGFEWEIKECTNNELPLCDKNLFGRTVYWDRIIYLNADMPDARRRQCLSHELAHVFLYETQITEQEKDFSYTEEMLCEFVGIYGEYIQQIVDAYMHDRDMLKSVKAMSSQHIGPRGE